MADSYNPTLKRIYEEAKRKKLEDIDGLDPLEKKCLEAIALHSDTQQGAYVVIVVSLATKIINQKQDIRKHQKNMKGGYSGRTVDTQSVTPFLKSVDFPTNKESGWLTRSLEQNRPYDMKYPGKIRNKEVRKAFLDIFQNIEEKGKSAERYLLYLFGLTLKQKVSQQIELIKPIKKESQITISEIISLLSSHFFYKYKGRGASRLPVLAMYAIYQCITNELKRFGDKTLPPLEEHTSADTRSGAIGDIEVKNQDGTTYEAVEVKHKILIDLGIVKDAYKKIKFLSVARYYILTTATPCVEDEKKVKELLRKIRKEHGCQIIVNGIMPTIKYYLRLLSATDNFIKFYMQSIEKDSAIRAEHKAHWNELVKNLK